MWQLEGMVPAMRSGQPGCPSSSCPPVIRDLLVIEMPNASDERMMTLLPRPLDRLVLGLEGFEPLSAWSSTT